MRHGAYVKRLGEDLARWREGGIVSADQAERILSDARAQAARSATSPATVASALGAILFGLGVITLVAANWGGMPKIARMIAALALVWLTFGGAIVAFERRAGWLGHSLALAGALAVGAAVSLIGQTYHIEGSPAGLMLIWSVAAIAAAIVFQSKPILILYVILGFLWYALDRGGEFFLDGGRASRTTLSLFGFGFIPVWFAGAALGRRWDSGAAMHLSGLGAMIWITLFFSDAIWMGGDRQWFAAGLLISLAGAAQGAAGEFFRQRDERAGGIALAWGAATVFSGALVAQFGAMDKAENVTLHMLIAAIIIGLSTWAIGWGDRPGRKAVRGLAVAAFAFECFYIYVTLFSTLLDTSLFLLGGGALLFALAYALRKITRKPQAPAAAEAAP